MRHRTHGGVFVKGQVNLKMFARILMNRAGDMRTLAFLALFIVVGCQHDPYAHLYDKAAQAKVRDGILIEPNVRVGKIRSGMTTRDVIAVVGEPDRRDVFNLEYLRFGFAVTVDRNDFVRLIGCGAFCDKTSPLIKMFAGRTKEGIGMGSTRSEVVSAFGPPTKSELLESGGEDLVYDEQGLEFVLAGAKVHYIAVIFPKSK